MICCLIVQNEKTIELGRKMMRASVQPISEQEVQLSCDNMKQFIANYILHKEIGGSGTENQFQAKMQLLMDYYKRSDWKIMCSKKKDHCEYSLSQLRVEVCCLITILKLEGKLFVCSAALGKVQGQF